jgi:DNA-directed RNA polymerase subunit RPC12/RpoP
MMKRSCKRGEKIRCPYCKSKVVLQPVNNPTKQDIKDIEMAGLQWNLKCTNCGIRSRFVDTPEEALKAWCE